MSVGAWTLAVFGTVQRQQQLSRRLLNRAFTVTAECAWAEIWQKPSPPLAGLPFSNYTGVLIGATVIPVWNENVASLPIHFGMSGLNSAVSILELMGHDNPALNTLGMGASAIETLEGYHIETTPKASMRPLKQGTSGLITRLGGVLSGPVPLALRVAAAFSGKRRARRLRKAAAISSLAGSMLDARGLGLRRTRLGARLAIATGNRGA